MTSELQLSFVEAIKCAGHDLASMSGVDLQSAGPATVCTWEARSLALRHLAAAGDMAETVKVMDAAQLVARRSRAPATNQPHTTAKETR